MARAMLELMSAIQRGIDWSRAAADELADAAGEASDRSVAGVLLDLARRHRVEVLKLQGQLAALEMEYTSRSDIAAAHRPPPSPDVWG